MSSGQASGKWGRVSAPVSLASSIRPGVCENGSGGLVATLFIRMLNLAYYCYVEVTRIKQCENNLFKDLERSWQVSFQCKANFGSDLGANRQFQRQVSVRKFVRSAWVRRNGQYFPLVILASHPKLAARERLVCCADSIDRRNTFIKFFCRRIIPQSFPRPLIELSSNSIESVLVDVG